MTVKMAAMPRTSFGSDLYELTKPRLTLMVVLTAAMGVWLAGTATEFPTPVVAVAGILGTLLLASGAAALNMWWEAELDARMGRTALRPIPSGRSHRWRRCSSVSRCCSSEASFSRCGSTRPPCLSACSRCSSTSWSTRHSRPSPRGPRSSVPSPGLCRRRWAGPRSRAAWAEVPGRCSRSSSSGSCRTSTPSPSCTATTTGTAVSPCSQSPGRGLVLAVHTFAHTLLLGVASVLPFALGLAGGLYLSVALVLAVAFSWRAGQFLRQRSRDRARSVYAVLVALPTGSGRRAGRRSPLLTAVGRRAAVAGLESLACSIENTWNPRRGPEVEV